MLKRSRRPLRLEPLDYMAIAAGVVNLLVVSYIVGYWLLH